MKRFYFFLMLITSTTLLTLSGCKKDNTNAEIDLTSDVTIQSDDHAMFSAEDDAVSDDVNLAVASESAFGGKAAKTSSVICDATVTRDSTPLTRSLVITYNGSTTCNGTHTRTGVVTLTMDKNIRWKNVGAVLTVNIQNLKITRTRDAKSLTFNGTKTIKNATGHLLTELASFSPIIHLISSSNMSATFDNGTIRQWQIAKQRKFNYNNGIVISLTGTGGTGSDVAVWGTNRLGQEFSTRIVEPLVVRQDCNFRLVSGKVEHTKIARPIMVTFGLDASGNATACPGAGAYYYYKAEWTSQLGVVHSIIKPY